MTPTVTEATLRPHFKTAGVIFIVALVLRLAYILVIPPRPLTLDDSFQWNKTATYFMQGKGFLRDAEQLDPKRPPVYPLFMAATYSIFGTENYRAVKIFQAVFGSLTCVLIFFIALLLLTEKMAKVTGFAAAAYPPLIVYCEILQSETFYIFLFVLAFLSYVLAMRERTWRWFIAAGVVLGLGNLCKATLILFPIWILAIPLFIKEERPQWIKYAVSVLLSFMVVAPWTVRNYKVYGGFLPVASGGPEMLWFGTLPWEEQRLFGLAPSFQSFGAIKNPIELDRTFTRRAVEAIQADPGNYIRLCIRKFFFFWFQPIGEKMAGRKFPWLSPTIFGFHIFLILASFYGFINSLGDWKKWAPVYLVFFYFTLLHTILAPEPRYRLPLEPFVLMFAVSAIFLFLPKRYRKADRHG